MLTWYKALRIAHYAVCMSIVLLAGLIDHALDNPSVFPLFIMRSLPVQLGKG